jgi:hypothetical protein
MALMRDKYLTVNELGVLVAVGFGVGTSGFEDGQVGAMRDVMKEAMRGAMKEAMTEAMIGTMEVASSPCGAVWLGSSPGVGDGWRGHRLVGTGGGAVIAGEGAAWSD